MLEGNKIIVPKSCKIKKKKSYDWNKISHDIGTIFQEKKYRGDNLF